MAFSQHSGPAEGTSSEEGESANRRDELTWEPYHPPRPSGPVGLVTRLRRNSFLILSTLAIIGVGALLYFAPHPYFGGPTLGSEYATLSIYSKPDNASVIIRGDTVGVTPLEDHRVRPGVYTISVAKTDYVEHDTVLTLRADQSTVYLPQLNEQANLSDLQDTTQEPSIGGSFEQDPSQNDGVEQIPDQESSAGEVVTTNRGSEPGGEPSTDGGANSLDFGSLVISSDPESTTVELNGDVAGTTPLTLENVPAGTHEVTFTHPGHETVTRQVEVRAGENVPLEVSLEAHTGQLRILVQPWGSISIEGQLRIEDSDVWYETELSVGTYRVTARHPTLGQKVRTVEVTADETQSIVFDMQEE